MVRLVETIVCALSVPVPEAYTAGVTAGTEMPFAVAAYPGQKFSGTVARIAQRRRRQHADDGRGAGRDERGRTARAGRVLSGPLARSPAGAVAARSERQRREHDRSHVRHAGSQRPDGVGGREDGPGVGTAGRGVRRSAAGDEIAARGTDEIRAGTEVRAREAKPGDAICFRDSGCDDPTVLVALQHVASEFLSAPVHANRMCPLGWRRIIGPTYDLVVDQDQREGASPSVATRR